VKVQTYRGDADLFVSTTNQNPTIEDSTYSSRTNMRFDQIIIEKKDDETTFPTNIYIGVFASSYAQYELSFEYTHQATFSERLINAQRLGEGIPHLETI
jgi:hypothetical protein